jgi:hypothetical protein
MSDAPIHEMLRRLFDVVVREAERNPILAQKLAEAVGNCVDAQPRSPKRASQQSFDAMQFHAVNILRMHGEAVLRGRLEQVRAVNDLKAVARASGLVLTGNASGARPSRTELILGIVEAAKHYDAQRSAATA